MSKYFLIQDAKEVKTIKKYLPDEFDNLKFVAWNPSAVDGLMSAKLNFQCIGDFYLEEFDWRKKEKLFEDYGKWCRTIDNIISEEISEFNNLDIKLFLNSALHKRGYIFMYFNELEKLSLLNSEKLINEVFYFNYSKKEFSPISRIIHLIKDSKRWNIKFKAIKPEWDLERYPQKHINLPDYIKVFDVGNNKLIKIFFSFIKNIIKDYIKNNKSLMSISSLFIGINFQSVSYNNKKSILVFQSSEQETAPILRELKKDDDINLIFWDQLLPRKNKKPLINYSNSKIIKRISIDKEVLSFCDFKDVNIFELLIPEIEKMITNDLQLFYQNLVYFRQLNENLDIQLVITTYELAICEAIFQQCDQLSIPHVVNLHGGSVGMFQGTPLQDEYIRDGSRYHYSFVYTNEIKHYLENKKIYFGSILDHIVTGSHYYTNLIKNKKTKNVEKNTIDLCIVVGGIGPLVSPGYKMGILDDADQYKFLYDVLKIFKNSDTINIHIKCGYDIEDHDLNLFSNQNNVRIIPSNVKLTDIMWEYDLYLVYYLSTSLLELIATDKPLLVFVDPRSYKLTDEAKKLLLKRVSKVDTKKQCFDKLFNLEEKGRSSTLFTNPKPTNNEFYEKFCTDGIENPAEYGSKWIKENILYD